MLCGAVDTSLCLVNVSWRAGSTGRDSACGTLRPERGVKDVSQRG